MYPSSDPRSQLGTAAVAEKAPPDSFQPAHIGRFYDQAPQAADEFAKTWFVRGRNFVLAHTVANAGAILSRTGQVDEYAVLAMLPDTPLEVTAAGSGARSNGYSLCFVPPGDSQVVLPEGGVITRLFTSRSQDLVALCANAGDYLTPSLNIPEFEAWPTPPDGDRVRTYSLNVPPSPGRFGRIWRCTTFMINVFEPQIGARDTAQLSPHHHDDFEQCSLTLEGSFMHHLRWPWTPDLSMWRVDEHVHVDSPSATIIPPPVIHTTRSVAEGSNQLVDIFCPPRDDFSDRPGWVLNAADYPRKGEVGHIALS